MDTDFMDNLRDCAEKGRIASGERNGNSKMTNSTVKKIRKLSNCGMKGTEIANLVGVQSTARYATALNLKGL